MLNRSSIAEDAKPVTSCRRLLIGHPLRGYQEQGLPLVRRKLSQGRAEILITKMRLLIRLRLEPSCKGAVRILALALAVLGVEEVAQDGEEPCVQVCAAFEPVDVGPGPHEGVLHQIVGTVRIVGQGDGKRP